MKTPNGRECPEYFQDFHRQRSKQECRLAKRNPRSARWQPSDCSRCPVPDILHANASPTLRLSLNIKSGFLGIGRRNEVTATCTRHNVPIADPYIGCPQCNDERPGMDLFRQALEGLDDKPQE